MKICLNSDVCEKYGLTLQELIYLLLLDNGDINEQLISSLILKGYVSRGGLLEAPPWISNDGKNILSKILLEGDDNVPNINSCRELAVTLQNIFPKGLKDGSYSWRGNTKDIADKLQKFFKRYGNQWSQEEIINATRRYVAHFNGDYTQMRILGYFILKHDREKQEVVSDLATWLETPINEDDSNDWLSHVV